MELDNRKRLPIFTIDWESWQNAVLSKDDWDNNNLRVYEPTIKILHLLDKYKVKAIFYVLGWLEDQLNKSMSLAYYEIKGAGHVIGSHGYWHNHNESSNNPLFRSPYWDTTLMPWPPAGGFFFRAMPYNYVKWATEKSGVFWIHPHDLDEGHPKLKDKWLNFKRHVGLKDAVNKLERLISEVNWGCLEESLQTKS